MASRQEASARPIYDNYLRDVLSQIQSDGGLNYESAVNTAVQNFSGYGISPQEIGDTLYGIYSDVLGAPTNRYYGLDSGGNVSGGSSGSSAAATNAARQALDAQEGRIGQQENVANQNTLSQYQSALNQLLEGKSRATRDYDYSKGQATQGNVDAKSKIDQNVGLQNQGLQRLLGARGAGNSSAARILAPYAAGLVGNQQRNDVQQAYGKNIYALGTNFGDFNTDWNRQNQGNEDWKTNQLRQNQQRAADSRLQIAQARQQLNPANAAGYAARIADLGSQIDALGQIQASPGVTAAYKAPTLTQYGYQAAAAPTAGNQIQQRTGAYYQLLGEDPNKEKQV